MVGALVEDGKTAWFIPFSGLYLSHARAALSSLGMGVRLDALRFVDMLLESFPRIAREQEAILVPLYASLLSSALRPPDASQTGGLGSMPSRAKSSQGKGGAAGSQGSKITLRFARVVESAHLLFSVLGSSDIMTHAQRKQDLDKALPLYRAYCRPYAMHVTRDLATLMRNRRRAASAALPSLESYIECTKAAINGWMQFANANGNSRRSRSRSKSPTGFGVAELRCATAQLLSAIVQRAIQLYGEEAGGKAAEIASNAVSQFDACFPIEGASTVDFQTNAAWTSTLLSISRMHAEDDPCKARVLKVLNGWLGVVFALPERQYAPLPGKFATTPTAEVVARQSTLRTCVRVLKEVSVRIALGGWEDFTSNLRALHEAFADSFHALVSAKDKSNVDEKTMHDHVDAVAFVLNPTAELVQRIAATRGSIPSDACDSAARWLARATSQKLKLRLLEVLPRCLWTSCQRGQDATARRVAETIRRCALESSPADRDAVAWGRVAARLAPMLCAQRKGNKEMLWGPFMGTKETIQMCIIDAVQSLPVDALPRSLLRGVLLCCLKMCDGEGWCEQVVRRMVAIPFERYACGLGSASSEGEISGLLSFAISVTWGNAEVEVQNPSDAYAIRRAAISACAASHLCQLPSHYCLLDMLSPFAVSLTSSLVGSPAATGIVATRTSPSVQTRLRCMLILFSAFLSRSLPNALSPASEKALSLLRCCAWSLLACTNVPKVQEELSAKMCAEFISKQPELLFCAHLDHLAAVFESTNTMGSEASAKLAESFCALLHRPEVSKCLKAAARVDEAGLRRSFLKLQGAVPAAVADTFSSSLRVAAPLLH